LNQKVNDFIKQILEQIKYKKIHSYIQYEIQDHIEMLKDEYIQNGLNEEDAYNKAILQMGDAQTIGAKLNQTHKPHTKWSIIILVGLLLLSGFMLTIFPNTYSLSRRTFMSLIISIIAFLFSYFLDYNILKKYSGLMYLFAMTLMILCLIFGVNVNGKRVFLNFIFLINIIPIVALFWLISYVGLAQQFLNKKANLFNTLIFFLITIIPIVLTSQSPYNALILTIGFFSIILVYTYKSYNIKNKLKMIFILCSTLLAFIIPVILKAFKYEYARERLKSIITPNEQQLFIQQLLESSKLLGKSEIFQYENLQYLYEFKLTFIITQIGLIAGVLLIAIIALMIIGMFKTTLNIKQDYGKTLSIVILTVFVIKFVINILMNLGLLSLTISDCYMPFMSIGGTSLVTDMIMLGIFLGVYRKKDILLINE